MEIQNFEQELVQMTKPEISQLKHQDILANTITRAKDKSVLSWWWLSIPLFIIAALLMKSAFMPGTTLVSNIHELTSKFRYTSVLFFNVLPVTLILFNFFSIRKIYFLSGSPKTINFLTAVWFNVLVMVLSIMVLLIYSL